MDAENTNQQTSPAPISSPPIPDQQSKNHKSFILIAGVTILVLVMGVGGYVLGTQSTKNSKPATRTVDKTVPTKQLEDGKPKQITNEESILYADNGFSFHYPRNLELYQEYVGDAVQWKPKNADRVEAKENLDALTLHESSKPLPAITTNGIYTIWNKGYFDARADVNVTSVKEESISLEQNKTSLFTIECGNGCHYAIVRFTSNKNYYEFIYNLNSGNISIFKDILAGISFFDPNAKEWKTYTSKEGGYSVQYPANSTVLEKVYTSVDGVRGYDSNTISIFPKGLTITFVKKDDMTLDKYAKQEACGDTAENKHLTVDNEPAIYQGYCGIVGGYAVYVKHHDLIYSIKNVSPDDSMLATFKFTD